MCGIAGCYQGPDNARGVKGAIGRMTDALTHRGPDHGGEWIEESIGFAMGHRRLAILDLSSAGIQPMVSADGRYVISFNGEIYNHLDLRKKLEDRHESAAWRSDTDTETLLECFAAWGVEQTLKQCVGMFAIALWDRTCGILTLARDRLGEKPLYYGWQGSTFLFGSELKALKSHPAFAGAVDRGAVALLLRHNCIPAPHSIYVGIRKLMPGHFLSVVLGDEIVERSSNSQEYWAVNDVVAGGRDNPFSGSDAEAVDSLERVLSNSIRGQMLADVPVGAFLSGGIDSSTVVALMQSQSSRAIRTFTIGSTGAGYDEAPHAKAVANHLGTDHTELYVTAEDALRVIPRLASMYCEPFADSSQIPTFLISQLAKQQVTVALTGDGGDELFGGYNRYLSAHRVWKRMARLPLPARMTAAKALLGIAPATWDKIYRSAEWMLPSGYKIANPGDKAHKLGSVLSALDNYSFYREITSHWSDPASILIKPEEPMTLFTDPDSWPPATGFEHWMMAIDTRTYLPDDILVKVDRAAMANSLETRVPMLDHRVLEFAWRLPMSLKIRNGEGKWLLRQVLYRHVPKELIDRPKIGFGIPLGDWLRGPLRDWAEALIEDSRLRVEGYFRPEVIHAMWDEHMSGRRNREHQLWTILMFQAWLDEQK